MARTAAKRRRAVRQRSFKGAVIAQCTRQKAPLSPNWQYPEITGPLTSRLFRHSPAKDTEEGLAIRKKIKLGLVESDDKSIARTLSNQLGETVTLGTDGLHHIEGRRTPLAEKKVGSFHLFSTHLSKRVMVPCHQSSHEALRDAYLFGLGKISLCTQVKNTLNKELLEFMHGRERYVSQKVLFKQLLVDTPQYCQERNANDIAAIFGYEFDNEKPTFCFSHIAAFSLGGLAAESLVRKNEKLKNQKNASLVDGPQTVENLIIATEAANACTAQIEKFIKTLITEYHQTVDVDIKISRIKDKPCFADKITYTMTLENGYCFSLDVNPLSYECPEYKFQEALMRAMKPKITASKTKRILNFDALVDDKENVLPHSSLAQLERNPKRKQTGVSPIKGIYP